MPKRSPIGRYPGSTDDYLEAEKEILHHPLKSPSLSQDAIQKAEVDVQVPQPPEKVRRLIVSPKATRRLGVDGIANDLFVALMEEARSLRDKAIAGGGLNASESMRLVKCVEALTKLSREMREKDKQERLEDKEDPEMAEELEALAKALRAGDE